MLGIPRQVYYRAVKSKQKRTQIAFKVVSMIKAVRLRMPRIGGKKLYKILYTDLHALDIGRDKLFAIMKANHLQIRPKRHYHVTTNSHHRFKKHKNLIEKSMIHKPEQVFVSDITYIGTREYPIYLALVTDAYSKKIMGFNVSDSLTSAGTLAAMKIAIKNRSYHHAGLIHHSDKGLQYCSNEYQKLLIDNKIICSMTEKYDPYQNAVAERVNGILKQEFLDGIRIKDLELMHLLVAESIGIYNTERPHYSNYYQTPEQMHKQSEIKMRTYKSKIAPQKCDAI